MTKTVRINVWTPNANKRMVAVKAVLMVTMGIFVLRFVRKTASIMYVFRRMDTVKTVVPLDSTMTIVIEAVHLPVQEIIVIRKRVYVQQRYKQNAQV